MVLNPEIMQYLEENKLIDLDDVKNKMKQDKLEKILQNHHYSISQGSDNRWRTYVDDSTKKSGRRQIAKATKEKLYEALYQHYTEGMENPSKITLRQLYPKWKAYKETISTAETNVPRIHSDWKKYYLNADIVDIPITQLKKVKLEEWVHIIVKDNNMTKMQYANFSLIIRQMLTYAVELNLLKTNVFTGIQIDPRLFRRVKKKDSKTEVYTVDEQHALVHHCLNISD